MIKACKKAYVVAATPIFSLKYMPGISNLILFKKNQAQI